MDVATVFACPFASGTSGNTSTEDLLYILEKMGYQTGSDFKKLLQVAKWQTTVIAINYRGHHIHIQL